MQRTLLAACVLALAFPLGARAQDCQLESNPTSKMVRLNSGTPSEQVFIGGGATFTCPDGKVIRADSAVVIRENEQTLLVGHASYSDREKTVTADRLFNLGKEKHLTAQSGPTQAIVVLTDKVNGSVVRGDMMDYFQPRPGQPLSKAIIRGGRPHAVLQPKQSATAPVGSSPDTAVTVVDSDVMEIEGQKTFHATGNVVINRSDMHGTGDDAYYSPDEDRLRLSVGARVTGQDFTLTGGVIEGTLAGKQFRDVTATGKAVLVAKDLKVNAPALTVSFDSGQVRRLVALSAERAKRTTSDGTAMAEALTQDFKLVADSIDALAPKQKIDRVVAVGRAYGERQNDSIKVKLPPIAARDWLRGDTITGYFADAKPKAVAKGKGAAPARNGKAAQGNAPNGAAPPDSVERVLERVVAIGGAQPASSMYRMLDQKQKDGVPAISYLLARKIVVSLKDGQVSQVNADGAIRGIHLQPQEPAGKKKPQAAKTVAQTAPAAGRARR